MLEARGHCMASWGVCTRVWCGSAVLLPGLLFVYLEDAVLKYKTYCIVSWCVLCRLTFLHRNDRKTFLIFESLV